MLVVNTVLIGLMMASFGLMSAHQPLWLRLVQLAIFGSVSSMQFTAMNTLTLKDLGTGGASSGNSLFSLVQMLSISLGVTVAGAILAMFTGILPRVTESNTLPAFHATFLPVRRHDYGGDRVDFRADRAGSAVGETQAGFVVIELRMASH